eukprot:TRINITY_DN5940_c0_g1_i13.p1 TRINITY_DN5940_c0_g1~~TRINITY_DN5940_c0_g1_i13.p1  ORF type:complete len:404 (+),score=78.49 TRINITY_DN5940_c0_g1_i13:548-1759(+)
MYLSRITHVLEKVFLGFPSLSGIDSEQGMGCDMDAVWDVDRNLNTIGQFLSNLKGLFQPFNSDPSSKAVLLPLLVDIVVKVTLNTFKLAANKIVPTTTQTMRQGEGKATLPQIHNSYIYNAIGHLSQEVISFLTQFSSSSLKPGSNLATKINRLLESNTVQEQIIGPLFGNVEKVLLSTLSKMHQVDYVGAGLGSAHLTTFQKELYHFTQHVLPLFSSTSVLQQRKIDLATRLAHIFLLQASIIRPIGEGGKLRLAEEMTQVEFALVPLSSFRVLPGRPVGLTKGNQSPPPPSLEHQWKAFRSILFQDLSSLTTCEEVKLLPLSMTVNHLFSYFSPQDIPLKAPAEKITWTNWLESHQETEILIELSKQLVIYQALVDKRGDSKYNPAYPVIQQLVKSFKISD